MLHKPLDLGKRGEETWVGGGAFVPEVGAGGEEGVVCGVEGGGGGAAGGDAGAGWDLGG